MKSNEPKKRNDPAPKGSFELYRPHTPQKSRSRLSSVALFAVSVARVHQWWSHGRFRWPSSTGLPKMIDLEAMSSNPMDQFIPEGLPPEGGSAVSIAELVETPVSID